MAQKPSTPAATFGFFAAIKRRDVHMAGLLVLDALGLPLSFHHTHPQRPGLVGRLLLGQRDDAYLRSRVLLPPLLAALREPPGLLLLHDRVAWEGLTPELLASQPALLVAEGRGEPLASPGDQAPQNDGSLLMQLYGVGPPTHLWGDNAAQHAEALKAFAGHGDLLEPFHRIDQVLQTLYDTEVKKEG